MHYRSTVDTFKIDAKITINATGPWAVNILTKNNLSAPESLLLSKGIHLVFPAEKLAVTDAVLLNTPDGKSGFAIRRWDFVYVEIGRASCRESMQRWRV